MKEKVGVIGHFIENKVMQYDDLGNSLAPMGKDDNNPKKLVDQNILKKGVHHVSRDKKEDKKVKDGYLKEEEEKIK